MIRSSIEQGTSALALCSLLVFGAGCRARSRPVPTRASVATPVVAPSPSSYPHARWRLAPFDDVNRTVLWVSQIVIRHSESNARWFRQVSWAPDPPPPARSADEAASLAERIARQATEQPERFDELAREFSEDVISRERGGSLGGVRAGQLPPEFLDVLATLKPGAVSRVFRTPFGFHILKRAQPPQERSLSGRRLAVGYDGTVGRPLGRVVTRTRDEAKALAAQIFEQAKAGSTPFSKLVENHSDLADVVQAGDLGVLSTRDPEFFPVEVDTLARLNEGEFSAPFDSRFGFEIVQRTPVTERTAYAMTAIELKFDPNLPKEDERSQPAMRALAERLAADLAQNPTRFAEYQSQYCCNKIWRWTEGRGPVGVTPLLAKIEAGAISKNPIPHDWFFLIPKRLDPKTLATEKPVRYELPSPERPDFLALLEFNDGANVAGMARDFATALASAVTWDSAKKELVGTLLRDLATALESDAADTYAVRAQRIQATLSAVRAALGDERYGEFARLAEEWATKALLG